MLYRNNKNGAVVDFYSEIKGGPWEAVEDLRPATSPEQKSAIKTPKKGKASK